MSGSVQSDAVEGQPLEGHSDQDDWSKVEAPSEVYSASMVSSSTSGSDNEAHQQTATAPSSAPAQASGALIGAAASASTSGRPSKPAPARPAARPRPPGPSPPVPSILSKASPEITPTEPRFSRQASQLTQEARPTTAPSAGGGWGSWNSWGITSTLRSAAAEAAKDMRDFSTSFQQALNAEDSDDEARPAQVSSPSRTVQSRETHRLASDNPDNLGPEALAQRQEVLRRLQGHDTSLEVGLKAIDDQVEQLAHGVNQTLGSFWGGARGMLQSGYSNAHRLVDDMSRQVPASSRQPQAGGPDPAPNSPANPRQAGRSLADSTRRMGAILAAQAESSFEELSRHAKDLLQGEHPGAGMRSAAGAESAAEETFDHHLYIFGGYQAFEELEALGNDCSRQLNRLRARLQDADKAKLDALTTALGPAFKIEEDWEGDQAAGADTIDSDPVSRGHAVIADLCGEGVVKAEDLLSEAKSSGSSEVTANSAAAIRAEGCKAVAEACALSLERLLALGRSLASSLRYSRPADDGIRWPGDARAVTAMLRQQTNRMLEDVEALGQAYLEALTEVGPLSAGSEQQADAELPAEKLSRQLDADCAAAAGRLQESFRALLSVVLLSAQDRNLLIPTG